MLDTLRTLPKDPAELRVVSELLMAEDLQGQLAACRKARFGTKSESADQLALDLQEDTEVEAAAAAQEDAPEADESTTEATPRRPHNRAPLPDHILIVKTRCCLPARPAATAAGRSSNSARM